MASHWYSQRNPTNLPPELITLRIKKYEKCKIKTLHGKRCRSSQVQAIFKCLTHNALLPIGNRITGQREIFKLSDSLYYSTDVVLEAAVHLHSTIALKRREVGAVHTISRTSGEEFSSSVCTEQLNDIKQELLAKFFTPAQLEFYLRIIYFMILFQLEKKNITPQTPSAKHHIYLAF